MLAPVDEPDGIIIQELILGRLLLGRFQVGERQEKLLLIGYPSDMHENAFIRVNLFLKAQQVISTYAKVI
jgi:hypothetical protein